MKKWGLWLCVGLWGPPPLPGEVLRGSPWLEGPPSPGESDLGPVADLRGVLCSGGPAWSVGLVWVVLAGLESSFQSEGPVQGVLPGLGDFLNYGACLGNPSRPGGSFSLRSRRGGNLPAWGVPPALWGCFWGVLAVL